MNRVILTAIAGLSLVACGPEGQDNALDDNTITAGVGTLNAGATIDATWGSGITSRSNNAGETVTVNVDTDVKDDLGNVIIPAGATVDLLITQLSPATNRGQADGKFSLSVTSTSIHGVVYPLQGEVTSVPHSLKDRGVGTAEVAKVGVGAAVECAWHNGIRRVVYGANNAACLHLSEGRDAIEDHCNTKKNSQDFHPFHERTPCEAAAKTLPR
jgi:hypothetical protein